MVRQRCSVSCKPQVIAKGCATCALNASPSASGDGIPLPLSWNTARMKDMFESESS